MTTHARTRTRETKTRSVSSMWPMSSRMLHLSVRERCRERPSEIESISATVSARCWSRMSRTSPSGTSWMYFQKYSGASDWPGRVSTRLPRSTLFLADRPHLDQRARRRLGLRLELDRHAVLPRVKASGMRYSWSSCSAGMIRVFRSRSSVRRPARRISAAGLRSRDSCRRS